MANQNESLDVNAKTIDEAIEQGLAQLGLTREQVDIKIIKEGKRGVFGIGAEEAQVRLTPRVQLDVESPALAEPAPLDPVTAPAIAPVETIVEELLAVQPEAVSSSQKNIGEIAANHLGNLLHYMGIKAQVSYRLAPDLVEIDEEPPLVLDITGNDLGILIGRRSETLQSLQYMVRIMVSKETSSWHPIIVDVEAYRVRRRRSLLQMAEKMAERAAATQKRVVLEAMPPHERRIIHLALKSHPTVFTKSVGSEDSRKVTIIPK